jgi:hypothetical protein
MLKEVIAPSIALEFTGGDGSDERDTTSPFTNDGAKSGKFWVYPQAVHIHFFCAIYEVELEKMWTEQADRRAEKLASVLKELGVNPDSL